jgi:hypothetical protein
MDAQAGFFRFLDFAGRGENAGLWKKCAPWRSFLLALIPLERVRDGGSKDSKRGVSPECGKGEGSLLGSNVDLSGSQPFYLYPKMGTIK